jgi:plasmid stabilization system protein ParE
MTIKILPSALQDLRDGWHFYDDQQVGLGDYFHDSLFSDVDSLLLYAGVHRIIFGYHRLLSKRFPYSIYYTVENPNLVLVWRILDAREDPESLKDKLDD